jgi:hypothetical protein
MSVTRYFFNNRPLTRTKIKNPSNGVVENPYLEPYDSENALKKGTFTEKMYARPHL